jgi:hypothetical protein
LAKNDKNYNRISKLLGDSVRDEDVISALESFLAVYKEERANGKPKIPLSVFSDKNLGILEATTKYLKENYSMRYCDIARLLNRDERTIWVSCEKATKKNGHKLDTNSKYSVPPEIFSNRKVGPLEMLVVYLKDDLHLGFHEISKLLNRGYMTVYLSYRHGKEKNGKEEHA